MNPADMVGDLFRAQRSLAPRDGIELTSEGLRAPPPPGDLGQHATPHGRLYPLRRQIAELLLQLSTYEEATQLLGGNPRRPRTAERIEDEISLAGRSQKRPAHQAQGFLGGMVTVQLLLLRDARDAPDGGELGARVFMRS